jgi:hypothetical protein
VPSKGLQIVYAPRADVTPESEVATLASVYRFIFDSTKKKAARPGGPHDAAKGFRISENEKGGRHVEHPASSPSGVDNQRFRKSTQE